MLPEPGAAAATLPVVLLSADGPKEVRECLDGQEISLPLVTGPDVCDVNSVPGPPYAVVTTGSGVVLSHGGANRPEQLASLVALPGADCGIPIGRLVLCGRTSPNWVPRSRKSREVWSGWRRGVPDRS